MRASYPLRVDPPMSGTFDARCDDLAGVLTDLARSVAVDAEAAGRRVTAAAGRVVPGCDHAAVSLLHGDAGPLVGLAASTEVARRVDAFLWRTRQGPGLAAAFGRASCRAVDLTAERRWPAFAQATVRLTPVRSVLAIRLPGEGAAALGALSLYADRPGAFDDAAELVAGALAGHAALAVTAARQRERIENLDRALRSNREIGMAIGVLMARCGLDRDEAFAALREVSQRRNVKLRGVADHVTRTGELPGPAAQLCG